MKKRVFILLVTLMAIVQSAFAYDFSAVAPSGQTLYYNIVNGNAEVTIQNSSSPYYSTYPTGDLTIPSSVIYNGTTYAVTLIGSSAFSYCHSLTSVTIPNSVTSIGNYAFFGCSGLTSVIIPNSVTSIGTSAFYHVRHIEYHGIATGSPWAAFSMNGVTEGDFVYSDATKHYLWAYNGTGGAVTIPSSVDTIGDGAFYGCSSLIYVTIPNNVTSIGNLAFMDCIGLTSVTIPNSVTSIGNGAFRDCYGLTSLTIGSGVTSIGNSAFYNCSGLTSIVVESGNTVYDSRNNCNALIKSATNTLHTGCNNTVIPNTVTSIGESAFSNCSGLTSVTIPNSVTEIGWGAFSDCSGLDTLIVGIGLTSIGTNAFQNVSIKVLSYNCPANILGAITKTQLQNVTIGDAVTLIGNSAFYQCTNLISVIFNADSCISAGDYSHPVFYGCSNLTNITFGNNVKRIPSYLCKGCTGLTSIAIPDSVTSIGNGAFYDCTRLTSVTIPSSVTLIGDNAFSECTGLTSIIFNADSCISAGSTSNLVFNGCSNLSSITFGNNVKRIPSYLCKGCTGLTSIAIPDSVTSIGDYAFHSCDHLTNITLGSSLQSIGNAAFYQCTQVVRIKSYAPIAPTVQSNTFYGLSDNVILNVPCGYGTIYENAAYWHRFDIQEDLLYTFSAISGDPSRGTVQIIHSPTCDNAEAEIQANPYHGFHFVRWSDGDTHIHRYLVVVQDTAIQAEFAEGSGTEGIDDLKAGEPKVYSIDGRIVVEGAIDKVRVYDMMGRLTQSFKQSSNQALPTGVYLVKIGDLPARRMVVLR